MKPEAVEEHGVCPKNLTYRVGKKEAPKQTVRVCGDGASLKERILQSLHPLQMRRPPSKS